MEIIIYLCTIKLKTIKIMRAILINPEKKEITEIQIGDDYKEIYKVIDCECFSAPVIYDNNDALYCDDEGLFVPQKGGIIMTDWNYPILGKMLILGTDNDGNSTNAKSNIEFFTDNITWLDEEQAENYRSKF